MNIHRPLVMITKMKQPQIKQKNEKINSVHCHQTFLLHQTPDVSKHETTVICKELRLQTKMGNMQKQLTWCQLRFQNHKDCSYVAKRIFALQFFLAYSESFKWLGWTHLFEIHTKYNKNKQEGQFWHNLTINPPVSRHQSDNPSISYFIFDYKKCETSQLDCHLVWSQIWGFPAHLSLNHS